MLLLVLCTVCEGSILFHRYIFCNYHQRLLFVCDSRFHQSNAAFQQQIHTLKDGEPKARLSINAVIKNNFVGPVYLELSNE